MHDGALESTGAAILAQETMEQTKHRGGLYSMPRPLGKPCAAALDGIILLGGEVAAKDLTADSKLVPNFPSALGVQMIAALTYFSGICGPKF
jgi:hypothetical protein